MPAIAFAGGDGDFSKYQDRGWVWMYLAAFGFGFLTSLTPCVYPMIPIIVGVFGARDDDVGRGKAFALATLYVLGMAVLYAGLGVGFAMLGRATSFGSILANPWVVIPVVLFYTALAASMFGAFEFRLPMSWQNKLNQVGGKGYGGAFLMGLVGGLTAAPCTGPFLAGILGFVATTGNVGGGFGLLFTYAIGMGVLFWVIAVFAASVPKSGRWMEWVKSFGGIALLAVGIYFLRPIIPALRKLVDPSTGFLIGSIVIAAGGALLGAIHLSFHGSTTDKARKGVGVALAVIGISGVVNWAVTPNRLLPWQHDERAAFAMAKAQHKGILIDFAAEWCNPCKELSHTFAREGVYEAIVRDYVPLKFDVTSGDDTDEERQKRYKAPSLPVVLFIDPRNVDVDKLEDIDLSKVELARVKSVVDKSTFLEKIKSATARLRSAPKTQTASTTEWMKDPDAAFTAAKKAGKGVVLDFGATWCEPCEKLSKTFAHADVSAKLLQKYVPVRLDMSAQTDADKVLMKRYKVSQLPTVIFFGPDGKEQRRIDDALEPEAMVTLLAGLN